MSLLVYCCSNHMTHLMSFFFNDTATTDIYTLSLHDALPISSGGIRPGFGAGTLMLLSDHLNLMFRNPLIGPLIEGEERLDRKSTRLNSSHSSISYAVFCLKKKKKKPQDSVLNRERVIIDVHS